MTVRGDLVAFPRAVRRRWAQIAAAARRMGFRVPSVRLEMRGGLTMDGSPQWGCSELSGGTARVVLSASDPSRDETIAHELAHLIVWQAVDSSYPTHGALWGVVNAALYCVAVEGERVR